MGKVRMISTETESVSLWEEEMAGKIQQLFHTEAFIYIVLDYAVVLGTYKDGRFRKDGAEEGGELYVTDETQKLWGTLRSGIMGGYS